ncbi:polypyrimidine tract-binding protein homolog 2 isoform X1 [Tanacetum coccineum]
MPDRTSGLLSLSYNTWDIVGGDVCKVVNDFFSNGKLLQEINHTIIALMPKTVGFHSDMIKWILACVTSTSFSINVNGDLLLNFRGKRGLRQGDPMSPYLLTLVMEILTLILKRKVREDREFTVLMEALEEFKDVSGLVPSIPKSTIFMCNVLEHGKAEIQQLMPFERGSLPIKYLGVSVISLRLLYKDSKVLVERGKAKVSWDDICLPKQEGGLGIRKLGMNNRIHGKVSRQPDQVANIVVDMVRLKLAVIRFKKNIHVDQMRIIWKIASISSNEG